MSIQVVTWMGRTPDPIKEPYYFPQIFFHSVRKFGYEPIVLGQGEWGGLGSKVKTLKKAISEGLVNADYVILTDSFDVVFNNSPEEIVKTFQGMQMLDSAKPSIYWNAEKACFPRPDWAERYPQIPSSFKYLNSGWGLAELTGLKKVFEEEDPDKILDDHHDANGKPVYDDDQRWWSQRFLEGSVSIGLDYSTQLCVALHDVMAEEIEIKHHRPVIKETGNSPHVWHFNGNAKNSDWKDELLKNLGYV